MGLLQRLAPLALQSVVGGALRALGQDAAAGAIEKAVGALTSHFTDHSQRLTEALERATDRAWKALEIALAGSSFWEQCKSLTASKEERALAEQMRAYLQTAPLPELEGKTNFRTACLEELRTARKAGLLSGEAPPPKQLAKEAASLARFSDPVKLVEAEGQQLTKMAQEVKQAGYPSLAWLLAQRPNNGSPLLVVACRYFMRRAVEEDAKLFQGLATARLEKLAEGQEQGFAALDQALTKQGDRIEGLLTDVKAAVVETHAAVLDLKGQLQGQTAQLQELSQAVLQVLQQHKLQKREVRPGDSMSIRDDGERRLIKQLLDRYRALPEQERGQAPALLNAIGKLEVWELARETRLQQFKVGKDVAVDITPDGQRVLTLEQKGKLQVWEVSTGKVLHTMQSANNDGPLYLPLAVSPNGKQALTGGDTSLHWWDLETGKKLHAFQTRYFPNKVHDVAFSPDGAWAFSLDFSGSIAAYRLV